MAETINPVISKKEYLKQASPLVQKGDVTQEFVNSEWKVFNRSQKDFAMESYCRYRTVAEFLIEWQIILKRGYILNNIHYHL